MLHFPLLLTISIAFELNIAISISIILFILIGLIIYWKNQIIKEKSKRIKAIKEINDNIHKNFNVKYIKDASVQSIGMVLGADRCFIAEYDSLTKKFSKVTSEYLASEESLSMKGDLPPILATRTTNICINNKILNIPNSAKYISENDLQDTLLDSFYKKYMLKSILGIPIRHSGKVLGAIILHYIEKYKNFSKEDIQFVTGIAESIGVALYQSNLYEKEKEIFKRDLLLKEITESIRSSLDINKMKQSIVNEIGKAFGADRCYLRAYDQTENRFLKPDVEYLSSKDIGSLMDLEPDQEGLSYFFNQAKNKANNFPIQVTEHAISKENIADSPLERYFKQAKIKSDFALPIWDKKNKLTFLVLHFKERTTLLKDEDKELLTALGKQISIALDQSNLYHETKMQAEREKTTREIIEIIRSSMELDMVLELVASALLNYFDDVQRVFVGEIDFKKRKHFIEISSSPDIKKMSNIPDNIYNLLTVYWEDYISKYNTKKLIENIENSDMPIDIKKIYINMGIKSIIAIPLKIKGEVWGGLFLSSINNYKKWNPDEIEFLESIISQLEVALNQAELFEYQIKAAQREKTIRELTNSVRQSLDINKIIYSFVAETGKILGAKKVFFSKYDELTNSCLTPDEKAEYIESSDIVRYRTIGKILDDDFPIFCEQIKTEKKMFFIENLEKTFKEMGLENNINATNVKKFKFNSAIAIPIVDKETLLGFYGIEYEATTHVSKEDIDFLTTIGEQITIAMTQAELLEKEKKATERERFIRETIAKCTNTFDIREIKQIVNDIGLVTKADRCYIVEINLEKMNGKPVSKNEEYLSSDEIISIVSYDFPQENVEKFVELFLAKKDLIVFDYEKIKKQNGGEYSRVKEYSTIFNLKSGIGIPFFYLDKLTAVLAIEYVQEKLFPSENELNFLRIIGDQIGIAFNQANLYRKEKQIAQQEKMLRDLINMIRSSLDINEIIHTLVFETGKMFHAERSFFSRYDKNLNTFLTPNEYSEYTSSANVKSFRKHGKDFTKAYDFFVKALIHNKKTIFWTDSEKIITEYGLENTPTAKNLRLDNVVSGLLVPIIYEDNLFGIYVLHHKEINAINQEVAAYMEKIAEQTSLAMTQSELLEKEKQALEREAILKNIIIKMRSSLNFGKIKHYLVSIIAKYLKAERAFLVEYDSAKDIFYPTDSSSEYLISSNTESMIGFDWNSADIKDFIDIIKTKEGFNIPDVDKYIIDNHLENTILDNLFRKHCKLKSLFSFPIIYNGQLKGFFCINFFENQYTITEETEYFVKTIVDQAGIALHQAKLYTEIKEQSKRELVLNKIIESIRSKLDINQRKKAIVDSIGKYFEADRCFIIENDPVSDKLLLLDKYSEYLSSPDVKSYIGADFSLEQNIPITVTKDQKLKEEIYIENSEEFIKINHLEETPHFDFFTESATKSSAGIPLTYDQNSLGVLVLNYTKQMKTFSEEDKNLLRIFSVQIANALHQSQMYEIQKKIARKESILKEIISEIKLTRDLNHVYNVLLKKLVKIFNLNRALFLESSQINPDELNIKYEYVIERKDLSVNNLVFPQVCIDEFKNLVENLQPLIINDVSICHPQETWDFFKKYKIQSLMSVPLVKYNGETKVLGFIVLCSEETHQWTDEEIDLITTIAENVVSVIWEISKFLEIEELRNSFILTLAHDFQVPLVGERTALEYLLNYSECSFGSNKEILQEILDNNQNISNLLSKSVTIYNYELGKKSLDLEFIKLSKILDETILLNKSNAELKKVKINIEKPDEICWVQVDIKEMINVFSILIENAIQHSPEGDEVKIAYYQKSNRILISIHNMGKPIPKEIQEKIFKRYEMAHAIERKIGAGTGLFLSKRIVEAHKGTIWFETGETEGTTFYISLPFVNKK